MYENVMKEVKFRNPIVHCITNYVTVNDCANAILATGGSPIMADNPNEVVEITTISNSLVINLGTLNENKIIAMVKAGKMANHLNHPIIFDPVGVGASAFRKEAAKKLFSDINFTVIRGNISEIKTLAKNFTASSAIDANINDLVTNSNLDETISFAKKFSQETGAIIAITGEIDIVANANKAFVIKNGCSTMAKISGTGCMLSAILGAFVAVGQSDILETTAYTTALMGYCGEIADQKIRNQDLGTGSFKVYLIDALSTITFPKLKAGVKIELY